MKRTSARRTSQVELLLKRIQQLQLENQRLRSEIDFFRGNPTIVKGLKGETLVAKLLSVHQSKKGAGFDLYSSDQQLLFEVKYSSLLSLGIAGHTTKRWVWTKLFGERGRKNYHRLLLVGDADFRCAHAYRDQKSPVVIFDLPYEAAIEMSGGIKAGRLSRIQLTTNPTRVRAWRSRDLFRRFQITAEELQHRYRFL